MYVALLRAFHILFELLTVVILARLLGAASYGVFAFVYALVRIVTIPAQAGVPTLLTREIPRYWLGKELGKIKGIIVRANQVAVLSAFVMGVVVFYIVYALKLNADISGSVYMVAVVLVPIFALSNVRGGAIRGLNRVVLAQLPESFIRPCFFIIGLLALAAFLNGEMTVLRALSALLVASTLSAILGSFLLYYCLSDEVRRSVKIYEDRTWLRALIPLSLLSGIQIINGQIGIVYLGIFSSNENVGIYRVLFQVGQMVMFALTVVTMTISPTISRLYNDQKWDALEKLIRKSSLVTFSFAIACCIGFIVVGEPLLRWVFGEEFSAGYMAGVIICLGQVVNALTGPAAALLNMSGKEMKTAKALFCSFAVSIVLHIILVPHLELVGAAIAFSISLCVFNILLYRYSRSNLKINPLPTIRS